MVLTETCSIAMILKTLVSQVPFIYLAKEGFRCNTQFSFKGLPKRWLCDGNIDCPNGFDEIHYTCNDTDKVENCKDGFNCGAKSSNLCLEWSKVIRIYFVL